MAPRPARGGKLSGLDVNSRSKAIQGPTQGRPVRNQRRDAALAQQFQDEDEFPLDVVLQPQQPAAHPPAPAVQTSSDSPPLDTEAVKASGKMSTKTKAGPKGKPKKSALVPTAYAPVSAPSAAPFPAVAQTAVLPGRFVDLRELEFKRQQTLEQLRGVELQIHVLETAYFENTHPLANALRGYDGLLTASSAVGKKAQFKPEEDRIFSGSSTTGGLGLTAN